LWEQCALPYVAQRSEIDLLHSPVNVAPLLTDLPTVVTVHDLAFIRHPERFHRAKAGYLRSAVRLSLARAARVIAVSRSTASDISNNFDVPEQRIDVVYSGVASVFKPLDGESKRRFNSSHFGGRPYILHVGTLEPRKNIDVLLRSFARVRAQQDLPHVLALAGAPGWMYEDLPALTAKLGLEEHVVFAGYVPPSDLPLWYNCADFFAYPSAYEGFGLPVLEAMACGVPVITSASSALQELASDACLTTTPGSEEELAEAMTLLLDNRDLAASLRDKGLRRSQGFTWEATARNTARVYGQVLREQAT
ncbi:MAG TPA: glycosyltransferase family 1 protein, partial [Chloroflexota bacterium]